MTDGLYIRETVSVGAGVFNLIEINTLEYDLTAEQLPISTIGLTIPTEITAERGRIKK